MNQQIESFNTDQKSPALGRYKSLCGCNVQIALREDETFPKCHKCHAEVTWEQLKTL